MDTDTHHYTITSNIPKVLPRKRKNSRTGRTGRSRKKRKVIRTEEFLEEDDKTENESLEVSDGGDLGLGMERVHAVGSGAQVLSEDDQEGAGGVTQQGVLRGDGGDLELGMESDHTVETGAQVGDHLSEGDQEGAGGVTQQASPPVVLSGDGGDLELGMEGDHARGIVVQVGNSLDENDKGDQGGGGEVTQQDSLVVLSGDGAQVEGVTLGQGQFGGWVVGHQHYYSSREFWLNPRKDYLKFHRITWKYGGNFKFWNENDVTDELFYEIKRGRLRIKLSGVLISALVDSCRADLVIKQ